MRRVFFLMLTLFSFNLLANLNGRWIGQGEWSYQGSGTHCFMQLSFVDTDQYLERKAGYFDCDMVGLDIYPAKFFKKGSQLLNANGDVVGTYIGNEIKLEEQYDDTVVIRSSIKFDGLHFDYNENWIGSDNNLIYQIVGRLFTSR
jgi:hypothetical protein